MSQTTDINAALRRLREDNDRLREAIGYMRWVQPAHNGSPSCAYCGQQKHLHKAPCGLDEVLTATPTPEQEDR